MQNTLLIFQIFIAVILSAMIMLQVKGNGFGRAWGDLGGGSFTRRGLESLIFKLTFVFSFLFLLISIMSFLI